MKNRFPRPTMLMILDGFGMNPNPYGNAITAANTPGLDAIFHKYPHTQLQCSGSSVGLPEGQMGNSEVGHMNIGAGRVIYQDLTRISKAIEDDTFVKNTGFNRAMNRALTTGASLHLAGLVSDGGVHSHMDHLLALLSMAKNKGLTSVYVHGFLDGRDVPRDSALGFIQYLQTKMDEIGVGKLATLSGRYYSMDRDKRWDRLERAYDAITLGCGIHASDGISAIFQSYSNGVYDEFLLPTVIDAEGTVKDKDSFIFFNFRPDRARELTRALVDTNFVGFKRKKKISDFLVVSMTEYDKEIVDVNVAFPPETYEATFGAYIASLNLRQLRISETEKYAHVTFFFNGGVEVPQHLEDRILISSPKVATYDLQPEMSAYEISETVIKKICEDIYDVIVLNFANADMVGHTGFFDATVKAVEALDNCIPPIVRAVLEKDGQIFLTADHGNADTMLTESGEIITSHSLNPVPFVHISQKASRFTGSGALSDIAPTILTSMGLPIPPQMTGKNLLK